MPREKVSHTIAQDMNIEFHYYTIYFLAKRAGIPDKDCFVIAKSSEYVDHNLFSLTISTPNGIFKTKPTQNYGFWDDSFPRDVYIPFHFFPAGKDQGESNRLNGEKNHFNCAANSANVKKLLIHALNTKNLYRIGIALHTFADSFAHQNFSGKLEKWNALSGANIIPAIGHAQALTKPDNPALLWTDPRLKKEHKKVNNYHRYLQAVQKVYRYLCLFSGKDYSDEEFVLERYKELMARGSSKKQGKERILDYIIEESIPEYIRSDWVENALTDFADIKDEKMYAGYSRLLWLRDSLLYKNSILTPKQFTARRNFYSSHFYNWHIAAVEHQTCAWEILEELKRLK